MFKESVQALFTLEGEPSVGKALVDSIGNNFEYFSKIEADNVKKKEVDEIIDMLVKNLDENRKLLPAEGMELVHQSVCAGWFQAIRAIRRKYYPAPEDELPI